MKLHGFLIGQTETLLAEVLKFAGPADATTSRFFRAHPKLGHAERGVIAEAVFAVLRRKMEFAHLAESGTGSPARRLTLLGLMQTMGRNALKPFVSPAEAAWLEHVSKIDPASLPVRIRTNLPDWIQQALSTRFDAEELAQLAAALNYPAPLDLRANVLKATREQVIDALRANGIDAGETPFAPHGVRVVGKPALTRLKLFEEGQIEVQDEGSQLLCSLVAPRRGEMVVDFCAGAGGKTLALAAMMGGKGRLIATDRDKRQLAPIHERLSRAGIHNAEIRGPKGAENPLSDIKASADLVVVDAPCTGTGTWRRNPDAKWRMRPGALEVRLKDQAEVLERASALVKPGGRIAYITCSVLPQENGGQIDAFTARHNDFAVVPPAEVVGALGDRASEFAKAVRQSPQGLLMTPLRTGTDGFFVSVLKRHPSS